MTDLEKITFVAESKYFSRTIYIKITGFCLKYFDFSVLAHGKKKLKQVSQCSFDRQAGPLPVFPMFVRITAVYLATFFQINEAQL